MVVIGGVRNHRLFCISGLRRGFHRADLLVFLTVLFLFLWCKFCRNLTVKGGKFGFQGFQLILLAPCAVGDSLECWQIHAKFLRLFLVVSLHILSS